MRQRERNIVKEETTIEGSYVDVKAVQGYMYDLLRVNEKVLEGALNVYSKGFEICTLCHRKCGTQ